MMGARRIWSNISSSQIKIMFKKVLIANRVRLLLELLELVKNGELKL